MAPPLPLYPLPSVFVGSRVAVVSGFLGQSPDNQITTLGRGGSDLTATVIGVACGADEVQVCVIYMYGTWLLGIG